MSFRRKRILVLMHESLIPPDSLEGMSEEDIMAIKTEYDVCATLKNLGHDVRELGVVSDLQVIRHAIQDFKPHICFNLLEEFDGVGVFDAHVVSYLEMLRQPYTGCNPRGLMLAHNKAVSKMILRHHRIRVPKFQVFPIGQRFRPPGKGKLGYPMIVKSLTEEGSIGISQASVVHDEDALRERVAFVHRTIQSDAIAEQYIDGREFYVGVLGNQQLKTFPVWEITFKNLPGAAPKIATGKIKWDLKYRKQAGVDTGPPAIGSLSLEQSEAIQKLAKRAYKALQISGYARMDIRLTDDGTPYILEANPNPELGFGEDFAEAGEAASIDYPQLIQKIVNLGHRYRLVGQV